MADEMDYKLELELLRNKLEKLLEVTENLVDSEVVSLSQKLDKLILNYYFLERGRQHLCTPLRKKNYQEKLLKNKIKIQR